MSEEMMRLNGFGTYECEDGRYTYVDPNWIRENPERSAEIIYYAYGALSEIAACFSKLSTPSDALQHIESMSLEAGGRIRLALNKLCPFENHPPETSTSIPLSRSLLPPVGAKRVR